MENEHKPLKFWAGFFLGGFFGGLLILLWGTKEGKKIAKFLAQKGEFLEEDIEKKLSALEEKGEKLLNRANETKLKVAKKVVKTKKKIVSGVTPKIDQTLTTLEDIQEKGLDLTKNTHKKFFRKGGKKLA